MTTPGHQAGPTPAEGGLAPGTGFPPGDGVPGAGDARYGPPGDGGRPEAGPRGGVSAGRTGARGRTRPRHAADTGRHAAAPARHDAGPARYDEPGRPGRGAGPAPGASAGDDAGAA